MRDQLPTQPPGTRPVRADVTPVSGRVESEKTTPAIIQLPFGANLEPALRQACGDRLSPVSWFRTDWQRGGALTGYATYNTDDKTNQQVVVKLPVGPWERQWLLRLGGSSPAGSGREEATAVGPRVFNSGESLGGYDIVWVVMERVPYGPLSTSWEGKPFDLLTQAAGRFYKAAGRYPVNRPARSKDWEQVFDHSRKSVHRHSLHHEQRWNQALKKAHRRLKKWQARWQDRPTDQWCHGDLHLANAMTRQPPPGKTAVLLDYALTHAGCWVEDGVYLEHLYWAKQDAGRGRGLCKQLARQRREMGLTVSRDWAHLAAAIRGLTAMSTPAKLRHDGDPLHVQAALEVLETAVA